MARSGRFAGPGSFRQFLRKLLAYAPSKFYGQAERAISNGKLRILLRFHIRPIKLVVYQCPS